MIFYMHMHMHMDMDMLHTYGGERLRRPILHIKPYGRSGFREETHPPRRAPPAADSSLSHVSLAREQEKKALPSGPCPAAVARRATASSSPPGRLPQSGRGARDRTREGESAEARAVGAWAARAGTREADSRLRRRIPQPPAAES